MERELTVAPTLSAEARMLVEKNVRLADWCACKHYARHRHIRDLDLDDWRSVAYYGLCKAATRFKGERGFAFATFATACINNELGMEVRSCNARGRREIVMLSLDALFTNTDAPFIEAIPDPDPLNDPSNACENAALMAAYQQVLRSSTSGCYDGCVDDMLAWANDEISQKQIASKRGVKQSSICRRFQRHMACVKKQLAQGGWVD